jgi:dihydroneopterin aldolase
MGKIVLEGLEFYAFHGYFPEEQKIGCTYIIDLELHTDFSEAAKNDTIENTINYSEVCFVVKQEMQINSKLIENLANRILLRLLNDFTLLDGAIIKISKINPPVGCKIKSASVVLEKRRNK